jgi:predicted RNA-binding protein
VEFAAVVEVGGILMRDVLYVQIKEESSWA